MVRALRDPGGANLDRIQIIKGRLDAEGKTAERVYDVACGERKIVYGRCAAALEDTVDAETASWTNDIGRAVLAACREGPGFDPAERAFYHARVIEVPTPRWTAYDSRFFGMRFPRCDRVDPGTRLHLADRVHAGRLKDRRPTQRQRCTPREEANMGIGRRVVTNTVRDTVEKGIDKAVDKGPADRMEDKLEKQKDKAVRGAVKKTVF